MKFIKKSIECLYIFKFLSLKVEHSLFINENMNREGEFILYQSVDKEVMDKMLLVSIERRFQFLPQIRKHDKNI